MEKPILQQSYLSGDNERIEVASKFIYELTIYKIDKFSSILLYIKYYSSKIKLKIKKKAVVKKLNKTTSIVKNISLIGAPLEFIQNNNYILYKPNRKIKRI